MAKKKKIKNVTLLVILIIAGILLYNELKPKISKESVLNEFNKNREHFNIVKNYMLTKEENYFINRNTYKNEIEDEQVKESMAYLINELGYESIYNFPRVNKVRESMYTIFIRGGNDYDEFGIIFTKHKTSKYGLIMDLIEDGWYFHWLGYTKIKS